jgi:hypothetical protein
MDSVSNSFCLQCGKRLKKLTLENGDYLNYHKTCWTTLINDIKNFEKVAYTKYNYKKRICGLTTEEIKDGAPIVVHFD